MHHYRNQVTHLYHSWVDTPNMPNTTTEKLAYPCLVVPFTIAKKSNQPGYPSTEDCIEREREREREIERERKRE